jgi:1-acyl-sn-glycerol-3-phosphate acyltransferase
MDSWQYEPVADFDQPPLQRLRNFPRHPDLLVYAARSLANLLMRSVLRFWNRLDIVGRENLPTEGSFVLVANHSSHLDAPALLAALPLRMIHRAFPAAASDYFFESVSKLVFSAVVMNAMPFDRRDNPRRSLDLCRQLLEAPNYVLILFPEGTRTIDGTIGPFKAGVGFLTAGTSFPVVPCYLGGAYRAWPKGKWWPRPVKLKLVIGSPLQFREFKPIKTDVIAIADHLRDAVVALSPEG